MIIRPIHEKDFDEFLALANVGTLGITNLPKERHHLKHRIQISLDSFSRDVIKPRNELYTFVIENTENGEIGGSSAIISRLGVNAPVFYYAIDVIQSYKIENLVVPEMKILHPLSYEIGPSEVCALFIKPSFRKEGLGRLLSLSRFLFIAAFMQRFGETFLAEMRGYIDKDNQSPFWNGIGRKFLNIEYPALAKLIEKNKEFIPNLLPKWPIYFDLLPQEVKDSIGKIHDDTVPALKMLEREGFQRLNYIDLFDGGPIIEAKATEIRCIKNSRRAIVKGFKKEILSDRYLISNDKINFRATYGCVEGDKEVFIQPEIAKKLQVEEGEYIRYVSAHP